MDFRLTYRGKLRGDGLVSEKQSVRRALHPQLRTLWGQFPLNDYHDALPGGANAPTDSPFGRSVGAFIFRPLVNPEYFLVAELDIVFLRPDPPGLVVKSGDIDGRMKTLFDALRMPQNVQELPANDKPSAGEQPFCVLLQDDSLISKLTVTTDRLLEPVTHQLEVSLLIHVRLRGTRTTMDNLALIG